MSAARGRILVADDDPLVLELMARVLRSAGFEVTTTPDGESAVQIAVRENVQAVVLDYKMPGLSGLDATRRLRASYRTCSLPILICTADGGMETVEAAKHAGADGYLIKPVTAKSLLTRLVKLLAPSGMIWA